MLHKGRPDICNDDSILFFLGKKCEIWHLTMDNTQEVLTVGTIVDIGFMYVHLTDAIRIYNGDVISIEDAPSPYPPEVWTSVLRMRNSRRGG